MRTTKLHLLLALVIATTFAAPHAARALSAFIVPQGGTASTTLGGILMGNGTSPVKSVTIGSGCTFTSGVLACAGTGAGFPFTTTSSFGHASVSTSTQLDFKSGFTASSTSYVDALSVTNRATASSICNFGGVLFADCFPGSDINAKIQAAYNAAADGQRIVLSSGVQYVGASTPINFNTANKNVTIDCQGSALTYTGSGAMFVFNTITVHHYYDALRDCVLTGPTRAGTSVALTFGGGNGSEGVGVSNVTAKGFGVAATLANNGYLVSLKHVSFNNNGKNLYFPPGLSNAGENVNITDNSNISNDYSPSPDPYVATCVDQENDYPLTVNWFGVSMDNCSLYANGTSSLTNNNFFGGYFEDPGQNNFPSYHFIHISTTTVGTAANVVTLHGTTFLMDGSSVYPDSYIYNAGTLIMDGVEAQVGGHQVSYFVTGLGEVQSTGFKNNLWYNGSTNVEAVNAFSPNGITTGYLNFQSGGAQLFRVNTTGFMSIGTSSQAAAMNVQAPFPQFNFGNSTAGNGEVWGGVTNGGNGAGGQKFILSPSNSTTAGQFVWNLANNFFGLSSTSPWAKFSVDTTGLTVGAPKFVVGSSTDPAFIITNGNSVGIGTTSPLATLSVSGTASALLSLTNGNATGGTWVMHLGSSANAIGAGSLGFSPDNLSGDSMLILKTDGKVSIGSTSPTALFSIHANSNQTIKPSLFEIGSSTPTATTTLFKVTNTGNVGIGVQSPSTALDVNGLVRVYQTSTTTCSASIEGSVFYSSTGKHFYGCNGTTWNQLDN